MCVCVIQQTQLLSIRTRERKYLHRKKWGCESQLLLAHLLYQFSEKKIH